METKLRISNIDTKVTSVVPVIIRKYIKWYAESPDLYILFNTKAISKNNPLLVLDPYSSLCWRGIVAGSSIGTIQAEALRIFGYDEVFRFLKRLVLLEFLYPIPHLESSESELEEVVHEFYPPEIQFRLPHALIPWYCLWEICTVCDLSCKTCYLPNFKSQGPSAQEALNIAQQIIDAKIFYVSIMGGEALLREDLEKIIKKLREAGLFVKLISNGQLLTKERAKALVSAGLNQIEISLDGLGEQTHDMSRGQGVFLKTLRAIRYAKEANIPRVGIVWTVHSDNVYELESLPKFLSNLNIQECYLSLFKKTGKNGALSSFNPINDSVVEIIKNYINDWKRIYPQLIIAFNSNCSCGRTSIVVGYNGNVRLCPFLYHSIGNVYKTRLIDIWRSIEANALTTDGPLGYCRA